MSKATDVRAYADAALEQGKAILTQAGAVVTSANKRIVADAPKPAFAAVGAADLVAETVTKRVETLPTDTVANLAKAQEGTRARLAKAQHDALATLIEVLNKFEAGVESAKGLRDVDVQGKAKDTTEGYLALAKSLFETLTARGEAKVADLRKDPRVAKVVADLRKDPRLAKFLDEVSDVAGTVHSKVAPVLTQVEAGVDQVIVAARSVSPMKSAAKSTPPKRASVATASSARPAQKAPAKTAKGAPRKSAPRKATATKPAATKAASRTASTARATARKTPAKKATASA